MHAGRGFEFLEQPLSPVANGAGDHVVAGGGELAFVDEGDEQAARLGGGELGGDLLETPEERDELFGRVLALGLGRVHEVLEQALVGRGVPLEQGKPERALGAKVVEAAPLAGRRLGDHGVDARRGGTCLA